MEAATSAQVAGGSRATAVASPAPHEQQLQEVTRQSAARQIRLEYSPITTAPRHTEAPPVNPVNNLPAISEVKLAAK
ncbi:unnamed protein product [Parnassius apollo]|uniref:(apollo) hypothetical protein n=1 Tax=Parnassius apollo TaxID=110799 RepID=A0A8S3XHC0_PARAO|nr:unnamed protein product [Parnassius apollo]